MKKNFAVLLCTMTLTLGVVNTLGAVGIIINDKTYVPVRGVFEELGFEVSYDTETATAIISDSSYTIRIPKDKTYFIVNDETITPDTPQKIVDNSLYLPLRAIGDSIGANTSWDNETKTAHISYNGKESYVSVGTSTATGSEETEGTTSNSEESIITFVETNSYGTDIYSLSQDAQTQLINFAEQQIKDGAVGENSIISEKLKYPHTAEFNDSYVKSVADLESSDSLGKRYGCKYSAGIEGYVKSQLETGNTKEVKYLAGICFNVENNELKDITLEYIRFND